jgi:hypothetical protein
MYLLFLRDRPELASGWRSEDVLASTRRNQKLPDAIVMDGDRPQLVVEFGGAYDPGRVEKVHADCATRRLPYELW